MDGMLTWKTTSEPCQPYTSMSTPNLVSPNHLLRRTKKEKTKKKRNQKSERKGERELPGGRDEDKDEGAS